MNSETRSGKDVFVKDFIASIVVFLVALPLCIGIAVAVGVSPGRALITGIVGGIIVGYYAGCPLQVSGPAAGLFVVMADLLSDKRQAFLATVGPEVPPEVAQAQAMEYALVCMGSAVTLAGLLQLVAGRLKIGQWFRAVSPAVIEGMLAGIGALILVSQFHVMLDHVPDYAGDQSHGGLEYLMAIPTAIWKCFPPYGDGTHHWAAGIGIATIAIMIAWPMITRGPVRMIPGALIAIVIATGITAAFSLPIVKLEVPANILADVTLPSMLSFQVLLKPAVLGAAIVIAIIASTETLLCCTAVDQMQNETKTDYDKELRAQGLGNTLCGLVGALPMTGVIVRSSANVMAGGKTKWSTIMHGFWLLIFVAALPFLLAYIPKSAMGAVLVYTGWRLIKFKAIRQLWKVDRTEVAVFLLTMLTIVLVDLLAGVLAGIVFTSAILLKRFSNLRIKTTIDPDSRQAAVRLVGTATFLKLPVLAAELEQIPDDYELHLDLNELSYIDHACLELVIGWAKRHEAVGGKLVLDWETLHATFATGKDGNDRPFESEKPRSALDQHRPKEVHV